MVRVCDAIMGSGKTESAITYINEHPDKKYLYVTPYLSETERICAGCPDLNFQLPSNKFARHNHRKTLHAAELIAQGHNVATTHQAINQYPPEMIELIKQQGYILFIDEELQVLEETSEAKITFSQGDLDALVDGGYVWFDGECYHLTGKEYNGETAKRLVHLIRTRSMLRVGIGEAAFKYYWVFPAEFIKAFEDVFLLTYMFDGQDMKIFLDMNDIPYKKISTMRTPEGEYRFDMEMTYGWVPEYTKHLSEKIHIEDDRKLNLVGKNYYDISKNWYAKKENAAAVKQLKDNTYNFFRHRHGNIPAEYRMFSTYKDAKAKIRGAGYSSGFVVVNAKATNDYCNKTVLAYCANLFLDRCKKNYLVGMGYEPNDDLYALSNMVQWIWRSAIRRGKDIYIYIPSRRMRTLLIDWINSFNKGGECA